ncbi:hypothetical protein Tsubulata_045307 [Turnera subulata]|uniref:Bet v I/Major latex protein domain-containing protein n=1 Tax=Turnera subulata TaxID=218843 RepID=A0A9Q0JQY0_9ROSI|nr:hypothetical protein Tsubulata_045307 [Turnera subulata]
MSLETVLELDCPPGKFVKAWKSEAHQIPKHTPNHIHSVELHEGDWEHDQGPSIKLWEYSIGGRRETYKERVEVDEANNIVKLTGLEGDPLKIYKVLNPTYNLEPKGEGRSLATLTLEYEKVNENVPNPDIYIDFKLVTVLELNCPPGKFLKAWKSETHLIPMRAPNYIHSVEYHESNQGSTIKLWEYCIGGKRETFKERLEMDEANNIIKLTGLEGDPMKNYKALSGKLETVLELECPPGKFLKAWKSEAHQIPKHAPHRMHSVELHEGDWDSDKGSSIKFWEYSIGGKRETFKERVEVDEAKNIIKLTGLEGDPMKLYKLEPKGQGTLATCIIEYEKVKEDVQKEIAAAVATPQALSGKLETVLELDCPPGKFLKAWKSEAHQIPKHTPNNIHSVELHEGDWEHDQGPSVKFWEYSVGGKRETFKERVEVDEAKNIIKLTGLEGDVMKIYKALSGKLETVHELDCPPGKFLKAWKSEAHQIPKHAPNHIHSVEVHEGDWEHDQGPSIKFWEYSVGGKRETFKERVEVDEANNIIKLTGLEGDVMKIYKDVPNPDIYMDFMIKLTKDIAAAVGNA